MMILLVSTALPARGSQSTSVRASRASQQGAAFGVLGLGPGGVLLCFTSPTRVLFRQVLCGQEDGSARPSGGFPGSGGRGRLRGS